jgi:hypothetical protein
VNLVSEGGASPGARLAGREPVLVACFYSSDETVACDNP